MKIAGSLCVISGASSGIGKATALELAAREPGWCWWPAEHSF